MGVAISWEVEGFSEYVIVLTITREGKTKFQAELLCFAKQCNEQKQNFNINIAEEEDECW